MAAIDTIQGDARGALCPLIYHQFDEMDAEDGE